MKFSVVGLTYKEAPIHIREQVAFSETKKIEAISLLMEKGIEEVVILSTCNRSEIYFATRQMDVTSKIVMEFFIDYFQNDAIRDFLFVKKDHVAIEYLYNVCSGLDSLILGEDQILGQVKDALMTAMELGASGKYTNKLFREAITTAKAIKNTFKISENPLSISSIAVKFLKGKIPDIGNKSAVIVGTGKMGLLAIHHLMEEGITDIYCCSRSIEKIRPLLERYPSLQHIDYEKRYDIIHETDILISATASTHTIIDHGRLKKREKPLYAMDLALPRDIDTKVATDPKVFLYDMDSLRKISLSNEAMRNEIASKAKMMIEDNIREFVQWSKTVKADPTIHSLHQRCEEIHRDTTAYIYRKIPLNSREQKIIDKMIDSALKRLINKPIIALKDASEDVKREEYIRVLDELFEL